VAGQAAAALQASAGEAAAARQLDAENTTMDHVLTWAMDHDPGTAVRLTGELAWWWWLRAAARPVPAAARGGRARPARQRRVVHGAVLAGVRRVVLG
jgi:hypothetical protein